MKKLLSVGTAVAVSSLIAANAEASEKGHEVQSGETLSEIAAVNSTTVSALKEANDLSSDLIFPGQVLSVSEKTEEKAETEEGVYVIQSGDTLFEIAVEFDLTVKELMDLNNLNSDLIFPGSELVVSADAVSKKAPAQAPEVVEEPVAEEEPVVEEAPVQQEQNNADQQAEQAAAEEAAAEQAAAEEAAAEQAAAEEAAAEQAAAEQAAAEQQQEQQQVQTQNQASAPSNSGGQNWGALAACESGGDASIVSSNGLYHGLYQFDVQTWQSVGGSGLPSQASAAEQTQRAQALYADRGAQPWPVCGSRL